MHTNLKTLLENLGEDITYDPVSESYVRVGEAGTVAGSGLYQHHWSNDKYQNN